MTLKLEHLTSDLIDLVKISGSQGIINTELAEELNAPMRRVYDVIITLRAAGLLRAKRERQGTRVFWTGPMLTPSGVQQAYAPIGARIYESAGEVTVVGTTVRITPSGIIQYVSNSGTELIIKSTGNKMKIEAVNDAA